MPSCPYQQMATIAMAICVLINQGCFSEEELPELAEVTGKVTKDGQPLKGAKVTFEPETSSTAPSSMATTDENGIYELWVNQSTKGAVLGQHKVSVEHFGEDGEFGEHIPTAADTGPPDFAPKKFQATVKSGENSNVDFEMNAALKN